MFVCVLADQSSLGLCSLFLTPLSPQTWSFNLIFSALTKYFSLLRNTLVKFSLTILLSLRIFSWLTYLYWYSAFLFLLVLSSQIPVALGHSKAVYLEPLSSSPGSVLPQRPFLLQMSPAFLFSIRPHMETGTSQVLCDSTAHQLPSLLGLLSVLWIAAASVSLSWSLFFWFVFSLYFHRFPWELQKPK